MDFELTVIQVTRLTILRVAKSAEEAKQQWSEGRLLKAEPIDADVIEIRKVA